MDFKGVYVNRLQIYVEAMSYRDFRTMWIASFSAGAAAWALIVARGWLIYEISDSSMWVGIVTFAAMVPRVLVTPFTGYLSDKFDRRSVVAFMFGINIVHNLLLGTLVLIGTIDIWVLVVLAFINGSARAAMMPASQALIPNLVPDRLLLNGIALNQAAGHGSRLLGPAAIAPLISTVGSDAAFFLCSGFYIFGFLQVLRIKTESTGSIDPYKSFVANLIAGLVYVYRTPYLIAIILLALLHCGLTMSFESLLPVLSRQRLGAEGEGFAFLMMAVGTGALISVLLLAGIRSEIHKARLFFILGILSGCSPLILAFATGIWSAFAGSVFMGFSQAGFMTITHTMIQAIVPDAIRGRVGAIYSVHVGGMMAVANLFNGGMADYFEASLLLAIGGVIFVAVMIGSLYFGVFRQLYLIGPKMKML